MVFKNVLIISSLCAAVSLHSAEHGTVHAAKARAVTLPNEIVQALNKGDAKVISKYFNSSVELIFSESRGVYAKAQAEQILKNFFNDNPPANAPANGKYSYRHLHTIPKDNTQYNIGELRTGKGMYRVCIFMKDQQIYEMRIENND
jgi:uncharacterized protein YfaS (alpha-2-macroglobulin family)